MLTKLLMELMFPCRKFESRLFFSMCKLIFFNTVIWENGGFKLSEPSFLIWRMWTIHTF